MKKPLTKEEFLERKNSEIHKEILSVFKSKQDNETISLWFRQFEKDNPKLKLCQFMGQPKVKFKVTYGYQAVFINMCKAIKTGDLITLYKGEGKTQVDNTIIDLLCKNSIPISEFPPMNKKAEYIEFDTPLNKNPFVIGETYSWENEKGEKEQGKLLDQKGDKLTFEIQ